MKPPTDSKDHHVVKYFLSPAFQEEDRLTFLSFEETSMHVELSWLLQCSPGCTGPSFLPHLLVLITLLRLSEPS